MNDKRIDWDFDYHKPDADKMVAHELCREVIKKACAGINDLVPDSREKSLAVTSLEQAMFWANAGIARNPRPEDAR